MMQSQKLNGLAELERRRMRRWKGKRDRAKTDDNPIELIYPAMWLRGVLRLHPVGFRIAPRRRQYVRDSPRQY